MDISFPDASFHAYEVSVGHGSLLNGAGNVEPMVALKFSGFYSPGDQTTEDLVVVMPPGGLLVLRETIEEFLRR